MQRRLLYLGMFLLLTACGSKNSTLTVMPEQWPQDVRFEYRTDGGMVDQRTYIFMSRDTSFIEFRHGGHVTSAEFHTSEQELGKLWSTFRTNFFTEIKTSSEEDVYDRGGDKVTITWGKQSYTVSNSGNTFIDARWAAHYDAIVKAILILEDACFNRKKTTFPVTLTDSSGTLTQAQFGFTGIEENSDAGKNGALLPSLSRTITLINADWLLEASTSTGHNSGPSLHRILKVDSTLKGIEMIVFSDSISLRINK